MRPDGADAFVVAFSALVLTVLSEPVFCFLEGGGSTSPSSLSKEINVSREDKRIIRRKQQTRITHLRGKQGLFIGEGSRHPLLSLRSRWRRNCINQRIGVSIIAMASTGTRLRVAQFFDSSPPLLNDKVAGIIGLILLFSSFTIGYVLSKVLSLFVLWCFPAFGCGREAPWDSQVLMEERKVE